MKENIKLGLLAVIAVTLAINTFQGMDGSTKSRTSGDTPKLATAANLNSTPSVTPEVTAPPKDPRKTPDPAVSNLPSTSVKFDRMQHDFGKVERETKNTTVFTFTNTGTEPLVIENAKGSCGCTVPKWPKEPIAPGATGDIEVTFDSGKKKGDQNKKVTITANTNPRTTQLTILADVLTEDS